MMKKGIVLSFATAIISGISIFSNKIFISQADPLVFTTVRNIVVAIFLAIVMMQSRKFKELTQISLSNWISLGIIGTLGGGLAFALFFTGLTQIGAVQGNLLHKTLFLWVALLAIPFLGEKLNILQIVGYILIVLATFVIGGNSAFTYNWGVWLVLGATFLWAVENIIAKKVLKNVSYQTVGFLRILLGIPVLVMTSMLLGKSTAFFNPQVYLFSPILVSSILLTGYILTWYQALSLAPATLVTSILAFAPIVTGILTTLLITHILSPQQILTWMLLLGGVILVSWRKKGSTMSNVGV